MTRRTPISRNAKPIRRNVAPRKKRKGGPRRVSVVRDKDFLWEVGHSGLCEVGLKHGSEGCSFMIEAAHGPVNGFGSKGGDDGAISLCRSHHREQHAIGWPAFEAKYGIDRATIAAEHWKRYQEERNGFR